MITKNQAKVLVAKQKKAATPPQTLPPRYSGKGTRARLNTAAEKMFNRKFS